MWPRMASRESAIDVEGLPGDIVRRVACQVHREVADV